MLSQGGRQTSNLKIYFQGELALKVVENQIPTPLRNNEFIISVKFFSPFLVYSGELEEFPKYKSLQPSWKQVFTETFIKVTIQEVVLFPLRCLPAIRVQGRLGTW